MLRARTGPAAANPFVDPAGYRRYLETSEARFRDPLARDRAAAATRP